MGPLGPIRPPMTKLELKIPPPLLMVVTGALMWWTSRVLITLFFSFPQQRPLAVVIAAAAMVIALSGVIAVLMASTTISPLKPENTSTLVVTGIYRFTRNPMYLGLLLVLTAWALYLGNLAAFGFLPGFVLIMNRIQIVPEERFLAAKFGPDFTAYCARVRRW